MTARRQTDAVDAGEHQQPAQRRSCRIHVGPWPMILAADRQAWCRGPGRRQAPDRGDQLAFDFTPSTNNGA